MASWRSALPLFSSPDSIETTKEIGLMQNRWNAWQLGLLALLVGCGSSDPFSYVAVSGTVKYDDDTLIPADYITVTFQPLEGTIDKRTRPRSADANVKVQDGTFTAATSHKFGDGIVPGQHKVTVRAFDAGMNDLPVIPKPYTLVAETPLEVNAKDSPFDIRVPKE